MADGAPITLRRHGNPSGPRISHGNGLAADLYYPLWSLLTDRPHPLRLPQPRLEPGVGAPDAQLPHLRQRQPEHRPIDACFGEKPRVGVFHSLRRTALLHHYSQLLRPTHLPRLRG